jgi:exonuclease SbcC
MTIPGEQRSNRATGYRPLTLRLVGFKGIKDRLGRDDITLDLARLSGDAQLIALAGPNGRGKTTIMDNLQPLC